MQKKQKKVGNIDFFYKHTHECVQKPIFKTFQGNSPFFFIVFRSFRFRSRDTGFRENIFPQG